MSAPRFPEGHDPAFDPPSRPAIDPLESVGDFFGRDRTKYIKLAKRRLDHYGVEEATLAPEEAVQEACFRICRQILAGKVPPVTTWEDWDIRLTRTVGQVAREKGRWQHADKRKQPERDHDERALLEAPDRRARRPDEDAIDRQHRKWLLARLDRREGKLRSIALMRLEGYTNEDIARKLGISVKTVEWRLRRIRWAWEPHLRELE